MKQAILSPFRVHFADGSTFDIDAADAAEARREAKPIAQKRETIISKVKLIRETA